VTALTPGNVLGILLLLLALVRRDKNRVGAGRVRCFLRLAWFRITRNLPWCKGRMPRCKVRPEPDRQLSLDEVMEFGGLQITYREGVPGYQGRERRRSS